MLSTRLMLVLSLAVGVFGLAGCEIAELAALGYGDPGDGIGNTVVGGQPFVVDGRVLDQDGNPVKGAKASWNGYTAYSDAQGNFSLDAKTSTRGTGFNLAKDGYVFDAIASQVCNPNSRNYTLWKSSGTEELVCMSNGVTAPTQSHLFTSPVETNGQVYTVDLLAGTISEGEIAGDFRFSVSNVSSEGNGQSWSFWIEGIDGVGVVQIAQRDGYKYAAPVAGYQPRIEIPHMTYDDMFSNGQTQNFFIQSRHGHVYARLIFVVDGSRSQVSIWSLANPSGSRNLEYNPAKVVGAGTPQALALTMQGNTTPPP